MGHCQNSLKGKPAGKTYLRGTVSRQDMPLNQPIGVPGGFGFLGVPPYVWFVTPARYEPVGTMKQIRIGCFSGESEIRGKGIPNNDFKKTPTFVG